MHCNLASAVPLEKRLVILVTMCDDKGGRMGVLGIVGMYLCGPAGYSLGMGTDRFNIMHCVQNRYRISYYETY